MKNIGLLLVLGFWCCLSLPAQSSLPMKSDISHIQASPAFPCLDTLCKASIDHILKPKIKKYYEYPYYYYLNYDFYSTVMASFSKNPVDPNSEHSNIYYYYNINLNNQLHLKSFKINTYFFNEFGKRFFIDSINTISVDQYYFKNTFSKSLIGKRLLLSTMLNIKSQFWRHYEYRKDSLGNNQKYLYNSYFTPGYILFSAGFTYNFWNGSSIGLGLASGKITKLKNSEIWESRPSDILYGVENGNRTKTIYGIDFQMNILPKKIGKHFIWVNNTEIYLPSEHLGEVKYYTLDFNNSLHYLFLKYLRISLQTQLKYDLTIQQKLQILNQVTIGFYLSNII